MNVNGLKIWTFRDVQRIYSVDIAAQYMGDALREALDRGLTNYYLLSVRNYYEETKYTTK